MTLKLEGLAVDCIIGEKDYERERPQRLMVEVEMRAPDAAAESDDIADAVDYETLAAKIRKALAAAKCRLIERAAKTVYDLLPVRDARVRVTKAGAVPGLASASVEYP